MRAPRAFRLAFEASQICAHVVSQATNDTPPNVEQATARQIVEAISTNREQCDSVFGTGTFCRSIDRGQQLQSGLEVMICVDLLCGHYRRARDISRRVHTFVGDSENTTDVECCYGHARRVARAEVERDGYAGPIEVEIFIESVWSMPLDLLLPLVKGPFLAQV